MAKFSYRVLVQDTTIPGVQFIKDIMKMQAMGATLDEDQVYMQFPRHAVFFLETDQEQEDYITLRFSKLSQQYQSEDELNNLSIEEWRKLMRDNNIKARNRSDGNTEYLTKFVTETPVDSSSDEGTDDTTSGSDTTAPKVRKPRKTKDTPVTDTPEVVADTVVVPAVATEEVVPVVEEEIK